MNNQENVDEQQVNEPTYQEYISSVSDEDILKDVSGSGAIFSTAVKSANNTPPLR